MYRIFIVEDDAAIAGVIRRHLEGWGYTVRCAERFDDVLSVSYTHLTLPTNSLV